MQSQAWFSVQLLSNNCCNHDAPLSQAPCFRAEGLHLIDFEQLKIENQSLNEKIEERNEELVKLRKKTTVTVQVGAQPPAQVQA